MNKLLEMQVNTEVWHEPMTFRDFLKTLLHKLWDEGEGFNGKRPWGNSGWQFCVYEAMIKNGFVKGELDEEYGWINEVDTAECDRLILQAIREL